MYISNRMKSYREGDPVMVIVIDGIIGAGKTTIGTLLSENLNMPFYEEIKSDVPKQLTQNMLDKFYEDPDRWSAIIQVMFLNQRFKDLKHAQKNDQLSLFDRSIYGDEVFARTLHSRGQMSDDELEIYLELLKNMLNHIEVPKLLVYLDVSVDTALSRIKVRDRSTENDMIPRDYMIDLKHQYDQWFNDFDLCPKIKIDYNKSISDLKSDDFKDSILERVKSYL